MANAEMAKGSFEINIANYEMVDEISTAGSKTMLWVTLDSSKNDATTVSNSNGLSAKDLSAYQAAAKNGVGAQGGSGFYFKDPTSGSIHKADTIAGTYRLQELNSRAANIVQASLSAEKSNETQKGKLAKMGDQFYIK